MSKCNGEVLVSEVQEMIRMKKEGKSLRYIATFLGRARSTVKRYLITEQNLMYETAIVSTPQEHEL